MLKISNRQFQSRLLLGTSLYPNQQTMLDAIDASGTEIVTVAIRRISMKGNGLLESLRQKQLHILPNTAGCYTAKDAVLTAELAREALETNWIKLEIIGDEKTLFPDTMELLKAAQELVRKNFIVLPYCNDDLIVNLKLQDIGCAAVMPLAAPIGSGLGICNPHSLTLIRQQVSIPIIIDAGLGTASDVAMAMELGADAVLINTAIAQAQHPITMAQAMNFACQSGRLAYLAGRIPKKMHGVASSPLEGAICQ